MNTSRFHLLFAMAAFAATLAVGDFARAEDVAAKNESLPSGAKLVAIEVEPSSVQLTHPYDYVQLLITGRLDSGDLVDLTRMAQLAASADVVDVSPTRLLRPKADGDAELTFSLAGQTVTVPVKVSGLAEEHAVDFVRDVAPVLSKAGCNAGTCHGSKDGKNGFKLSLRGYDPLYDHLALTDDLAARRMNRASPDDSLMLLKPTGSVPHVGSQVIEPHGAYYEIIRAWIADGAKLDLATPRVERIEVFPKNPIVQREGMRQQMRVLATYADGAVRDVTAEAFIESGNTDCATADKSGLITVLRRGEAPVLVRYEGRYAATTVSVMGDRSGFVWQQPPAINYIDELVADKLRRTKTLPGELCTDAEFLRRIYLDLTGLAPSPEAVRAFLADPRETRVKRDEVVEQLIGSPEFVEHWTNKWADLLQVNRKYLGEAGAVAFRNWIKQAVASNMPYDELAYQILTASGSNRENPAASYYKILRTPAETMENTTHLFLAVRFNCNKCHDHPFERWTQDQYYNMAANFARVGLKSDPTAGDKKIEGTAVEEATPLYEVVYDMDTGEVTHDRTGQITPPAFPYETEFDEVQNATRRERLARWITAKDNRYFAKSYVNRLWGYLLGVGLIEPIDDIRAGNPPTNPELLDRLTQQFLDSDFDVQDLLRTICKSRTYQLSVTTNRWNEDDTINYSHALARRLPAEVLFDAIHQATGSVTHLPGMPAGMRAAQIPDSGLKLPSGFLDQFGRPPRESSCECERASNLMLGPVMALVNGPTVAGAIADPENAITKLVAQQADDGKLVEELFLRILSRPPTNDERQAGIDALRSAQAEHPLRLAELAAYEKTLEPKLVEWESQQQAAAWTALDFEKRSATNEATLTKEQDLSIFATGTNGKGQYELVARTDAQGITAVRVELMADDRLPSKGPGRASNGNFVLSELRLSAAPLSDPEKSEPVVLQNAQADFSQNGYAVAAAIDGSTGSGWATHPKTGENRIAVFETKTDVAYDGGALLTLVIDQQFVDGAHSIGRFRISITTAPRPVGLEGPPPAIAALLAVPADQRSAEQQAALMDHFRSMDPRWKELQAAVYLSAQQLSDKRLIGAQDLTWALINTPAFLFNR